jgi:hypothetical protein
MDKVIPTVRVTDIPFFEGRITRADKEKYGMIMPSGKDNDYRIAIAKGQGGSAKEETWERTQHWHSCCKSKVAWRHKTSCPRLWLD